MSSLDIICFSHLSWDRGLFQRPQQIMSRLAGRGHTVLFVEKRAFRTLRDQERRKGVLRDASGVHLYCPIMMPSQVEESSWGAGIAASHLRFRVRRVARRQLGMRQPVLWNYHPNYAHTVGRMGERLAVYDCMDDHRAFMDGRGQVVEKEQILLRRSHVVFAGGLKMRQDRLVHAPEIHFFPCGVEVEHFTQAYDELPGAAPKEYWPDDIRDLSGPILGYWGAVDYRIDWELMQALATARPSWTLLLLGPVVKMPEEELRAILRAHPNIRWLGPRPYDLLPAYALAFSACLMPWVERGDAESINPTKALEYLATGRPVISTRIHDVVAQYEPPAVELASGASEFEAACARALAGDSAARREARRALTDGKSWDAMVEGMERKLIQAMEARV
jgi:glycosyltransferase involved in cell wall biosynthesis